MLIELRQRFIVGILFSPLPEALFGKRFWLNFPYFCLWNILHIQIGFSKVILFLGGAPTYICHFPSVHLCVAYHISGTEQHLIIIFGTHVLMVISPGVFFSFFQFLIFWAVRGKRAKNNPRWKITIRSITCHIWGTV